MKLSPAIAAYFEADRTSDNDALIASFAPDAVVFDEGTKHKGHAEILSWLLASKAKYANLVSEPVEQTIDGDRVVVRSRVSGDFPNSPAMLDYTFTLTGDWITSLDIH